MAGVTPEMSDLARRLLDREAGGSQNPVELADAMESACSKLWHQLAPLFGATSFQALTKRAIHLAGLKYPFLVGVDVQLEQTCRLNGLREGMIGLDSAAAAGAMGAVLANQVLLLCTFIGDDFGMSLVMRGWPDMPLDRLSDGPGEAKE